MIAVRRSLSQLILAFFGLTLEVAPQSRVNLFSQIHEIVFHGKGGYDWHTIYNMPIWLRKFTFHKIEKWYSDESEAINKTNQGNSTQVVSADGKINVPEFAAASKQYKQNKQPTYSTKALRK